MATLKVSLIEIIDDGFPAFGVFTFTDLSGSTISIHEKLPVLGVEDAGLTLPTDVKLECSVVSVSETNMLIDISEPHGIEDTQGQTRFRVSASSLVY